MQLAVAYIKTSWIPIAISCKTTLQVMKSICLVFSRGAYTVRCLCGLINNCGIVTRPDAKLIQQAFDHYKMKSKPFAPEGERSVAFRQQHSHPSREVAFVGVWDTVGAMGIPVSFLGLFEDKDEFYDTSLGIMLKWRVMLWHWMSIVVILNPLFGNLAVALIFNKCGLGSSQ
ncbi:DUF2235 domain-containing protein [Paucibacter sp. O1-1]|nr:DUF2235 domain-containing protein [Paucibacter sp. O1-1]MDA3825277.1 DUF2235 domain-containing protein [Paucibacter sp. O1-1]